MEKKIKNAIILVLVVFVIVAIQQGILYTVDKSISHPRRESHPVQARQYADGQ